MRNTVVMIVLALLAAATGLVRWQRETPAPAPAVGESTSPLGYYLHGARLLGTERGRVVYRVSAARLEELPGEDRLRFETVSVDYRPNDASAWEISAATASGSRDGSLLELAGNVELRSAPEDAATPVFFATAKLRFSPDTSIAESAEPVEFRVGDWQLEAKGLRTNLKDETLTLESEVHGTFAPR
jgi:LPS export ABC transporter protein LptC